MSQSNELHLSLDDVVTDDASQPELEEQESDVESIGEDGEKGISLSRTAEADEDLWVEATSSQDPDYVDVSDEKAELEGDDAECLCHDGCIAQALKVDEFIRKEFEGFTPTEVRLSSLCELICDHYRSIE